MIELTTGREPVIARKQILELLKEPKERNELIQQSKLTASQTNIILSSMEIKGLIKETLGKIHLS